MTPPGHRSAGALWLLLALGLAGCASREAVINQRVSDPLEPVNRAIYKFNDTADQYVLRPVAVGYTKAFPPPMRSGVHNFLTNLTYPVVIVNDLLQGKLKAGGQDTARFLINTIVGLGGIFDPATEIGLAEREEDFGQTLAHWGVKSGPFLMLPLLGPSTLRDTTGMLADTQVTPYVTDNRDVAWGYLIMWGIDRRSRLLDLDEQVRQAYDPYLFVRDAYIQNRRYKIADGNLPPADEEDFSDEDDAGDAGSPDPGAGDGQE